MHLLAARPGGFAEDDGIIDLGQTPGDVVILCAADSVLTSLAVVAEALPPDFPEVRMANWMQLLKPAALDLYQDRVLDRARVVVVSLLGGAGYWPYGMERLKDWAARPAPGFARWLIMVPGDDSPDPELSAACTVPGEDSHRVWRYLREGGAVNHRHLFHFLAARFLGRDDAWNEPRVLPPCLLYRPNAGHGRPEATYGEWQQRWNRANPCAAVALLLFYRSHLQTENAAMFDRLIGALEGRGVNVLPVAIASLKDPESLRLVNELLEQSDAGLIVNTTGFASQAVSETDSSHGPTTFVSPFCRPVPVLQLILSSSTESNWRQYSHGLRSRDIAMQMALPEMDGRIVTRPVSFKSEAYFARRSQISVVGYELHAERADFVARLSRNLVALAEKPNSRKRLALILANYPTRDGRIGNGVGLDTPASAVNILERLKRAGYPVDSVPDDGNALMENLLGAVTNNSETMHCLPCWQSLAIEEYIRHFRTLPESARQAVNQRWGTPGQDPRCRRGRLMISGIRLGETFVGIQPARGFNLDLAANYHDPDLVPPHSYLAFYFWLRHRYEVDAVIHLGKHGNLEWLPGKGSGLSKYCWPDIALGPIPHFYPFIVNDPGEGTQAKRRAQAVIIDHLMPPMTRAETYGELSELEALVDEYYQAMGMDARREAWLRTEILKTAADIRLTDELNLDETAGADDILSGIDTWLCEIKEAQIRNGLHVLGQSPPPGKLADTLVALLRLPRGEQPQARGLLHCLAEDLDLHENGMFLDPLLDCTSPWCGNRPRVLLEVDAAPWRSHADARERLEILAVELVGKHLVDGADLAQCTLPATRRLLTYARDTLVPALMHSAGNELDALAGGLEGRFVDPGPSGAPTRGRLDTLPTGRNFFSVDSRSIPTVAAWAIGQRSAQALIERHLQEFGDYPGQMGLSVWGTATMRTGGDDIAQAFALMGVKPVWAPGSQRVVDFEIVPAMLLGRPRIDVMLRVSGFFRDAFPNVMRIFDAAVLALSTYEDPGGLNVIRDHIDARTAELRHCGREDEQARREASYRVFGSRPGAYGAGLQGLIDERCWHDRADLADAYLNWGGYAYGRNAEDGDPAREAFADRLSRLDAVIHNQDNREHDILDSDDYYQFQGGMANAVRTLSGNMPHVYHNDHSNPARPRVRTLKEELNRVIRSRVLNPKWQSAMREHGYKGASEMAASVDYLFAYDATTSLIDDYQYVAVSESLVFDPVNQDFLKRNNLPALEEMAERLLEAARRGLWQDPGNHPGRLQDLLLEIDSRQEGA